MTTDESTLQSELTKTLNALQEQLTPLSPEAAITRYLRYKQSEIRSQTVTEYERKLAHFKDSCAQRDLENVNDLDARFLSDFYDYRRLDSHDLSEPLSAKTLNDDMYLLGDFLSFLESIDAVRAGLSDQVRVPHLDNDDSVRDIYLSSDQVDRILEYLDTHQYARAPHAIWTFHTHTGRRPGGLHAIDLADLHLNESEPYIEIRHRPGETELKNATRGENEVYLSAEIAQIFRDYIDVHRSEVTTESDRKPFVTTRHGQMSKSTMRKYVYRFSRPCVIGECPHGRDPGQCTAAQTANDASKCPSSRPPCALRHGYVTAVVQDGVPPAAVSGRCDVTEKVLEKHYDERDETSKRQLRRKTSKANREQDNGGGYL